MIAVIPCIMDINSTAAAVIAVAEHRVADDMNKHRPASIDLGLKIREGKSQHVTVISEYHLIEILTDCITPRLDEKSESMSPIPSSRRLCPGIVVQPRTVSIIVERGGAITITPDALVSSHIIPDRITELMSCPSVGDIRIRAAGTV